MRLVFENVKFENQRKETEDLSKRSKPCSNVFSLQDLLLDYPKKVFDIFSPDMDLSLEREVDQLLWVDLIFVVKFLIPLQKIVLEVSRSDHVT